MNLRFRRESREVGFLATSLFPLTHLPSLSILTPLPPLPLGLDPLLLVTLSLEFLRLLDLPSLLEFPRLESARLE